MNDLFTALRICNVVEKLVQLNFTLQKVVLASALFFCSFLSLNACSVLSQHETLTKTIAKECPHDLQIKRPQMKRIANEFGIVIEWLAFVIVTGCDA